MIGEKKDSGLLEYKKIIEAGHMVLFDKPAAALQLLNEFI